MKERPQHVLQLISSLEVGGSEKLLLSFLSACRDDERVNHVIVVMNRNINPEMQDQLDKLAWPTYYLDRPQGHMHPRYLKKLLEIIHRHDIGTVHAHNTGSKLWASLCKLAMPDLKLVFTIHDTVTVPKLGWPQVLLHRHWIDRNIAISKSVEALCHARDIKNVTQVYNGIPLWHFANPNRSGLRDRLARASFDEKPMHILHVGRMETRIKGQDILIRAVRQCRDHGLNVQVTLMGGVYDYNRHEFEALECLRDALNLNDEIVFAVNRTDVPEMLADADLFVLPSRFEGLGLVILEAMAAGVPVIASNTEGPRELVKDGENGYLFETGNPEDLFMKIRMMYRLPETADRMRAQALDFVRRFDVWNMKEAYYRLYTGLSDRRADWVPDFGRLTDGTSV